MKYDVIEITRDHDGTYYSNLPGMPEYVPYHKLRNAIMLAYGWIPDPPALDFRKAGRKSYAYFRPAA